MQLERRSLGVSWLSEGRGLAEIAAGDAAVALHHLHLGGRSAFGQGLTELAGRPDRLGAALEQQGLA